MRSSTTLASFIVSPLALIAASIVLSGIGCGGGGSADEKKDAPPPPGAISASWSLSDLSGSPLTCDLVDASTVTMSLREHGGPLVANTPMPCGALSGSSSPIPAGVYDATLELSSSSALSIATGSTQFGVIVSPGATARLDPVSFPLNPLGGIQISLTAVAQGIISNCAPSSMMGAGITAMTVELTQQAGGCEPVLFFIDRGQAPLGSYQVNCSSPVVASCFDADETLAAAGIPSGAYEARVTGRVNAQPCWAGAASLRVTAQGLTESTAISLVLQDAPGCPK